MSIFHFLLYWAVFGSAIALYLCYLLVSGGWVTLQNYYDFNYLINALLIKRNAVLEGTFPLAFGHAHSLMTLSIVGFLMLLVCSLRPKARHLHLLTAFIGVALLLSLFLYRVPGPRYVMSAAPVMAISVAGALHGISSG